MPRTKWDVACWVVARRRYVAGAWLLAAAALLPFARHVEARLDVAARVDGSESAQVERVLAERFESPFARYATLVITGGPAVTESAGRALLAQVVAALRTTAGVAGTLSYLDTGDSLLVGADGSGAIVVVGLSPGNGSVDALVAPLRARTHRLLTSWRQAYPTIALRWTGEVALNADLRRTSAENGERAEQRALPLTVLLLVLAFGTVRAAFIPVAVALLAIGLSFGAAALIAPVWPLSILLQNVVTMLGLGLGIDYALLTVSRFREAVAAGRSVTHAAEDAARYAGRTIVLSGLAVIIGFGALLSVPVNELRSVAVGGLLVVVVSVLLAATLLPGVLVWVGPMLPRGRAPVGPGARQRWWHWRPRTRPADRWRWWSGVVTRRPVAVLVLAGAPVVLLAVQARRLSTDLPRGDWLPPQMESAQAWHDLQRMQRSSVVQSVRVLLELPPGTAVTSDAGWSATARLGRAIAADPQVGSVRALALLGATGSVPRAIVLAVAPAGVRRSFVSRDTQVALLEVMPREGAEPRAVNDLVRMVRGLRVDDVTGIPGARLAVGGLPAFNVDYSDAVSGRLPGVVGAIVAGTLFALAFGFRSLLIPLKAVVLNLLSVCAAFGALVVVFFDGHGLAVVGLSAPVDGIFPIVPVLVFCIVFGLSMDYEVFLIARVAEARRAGFGEREAVAEGVLRTGGIVTSAAAIMIVVFAAFTLGGFVLMKMLGFALAVAVLLDATVMRLAIGPAVLVLAGRWNWWPGEPWRRSAPPREELYNL